MGSLRAELERSRASHADTLRRWEETVRECEQLREALMALIDYSDHVRACSALPTLSDSPCDCGYRAVIDKAEAALK